MKIRDIDTLMIDSPGRKWTIVRVFTDEGLVGLGEATYSNKEPIVAAAVDNMKEELIGEDPARIEYLWHKIYRLSTVSGIWRMAGPVWMSALSGIDQALWDIKGKAAGLPVVDLLGGKFRDGVEVYTHFSGQTPEACAAMAKSLIDQGHGALKSGALSSSGFRLGTLGASSVSVSSPALARAATSRPSRVTWLRQAKGPGKSPGKAAANWETVAVCPAPPAFPFCLF